MLGDGGDIVTVEYRGRKYEYKSHGMSLESLQSCLENDTGVSVDNQKLIASGGILIKKADDFDFENSVSKKLKLFGARQDEIEKAVQLDEKFNGKVRIKDDLSNSRGRRRPRPIKRKSVLEYRFENIKTLDGFADQQKATEILTRLSEEPGFLAVLAQRKWKVGVLSEMYPKGQVGISEVCVLGLNVNKGQEISLRIRTDDLRGFRKYLSIKKVLCHELAHMVHSEHDDNFFMLMREIENDIVALDWRQKPGHQIGGKPIYRPLPEEYADEEDNRFNGGTHVLGGDLSLLNLPLREKIILAAERRIVSNPLATTESRERHDSEVTGSSHVPEDTEVNDDEKNGKSVSAGDNHDFSLEPQSRLPATPSEPIVPSFSHIPTPSVEDQQEISQSLEMLSSRNRPEVAVAAMEMILKYVQNILGSPSNESYRRVNIQNRAFQNKIAKSLSGRHVMNSMGWRYDESSQLLIFPEENEAFGLLMYAKGELENCIQLLRCLS